jgi:hypothetical protein
LSVFLPYSSSYSVHSSFFTFFSASRHIPGHTVFVSHFPHFSVFSPKSRSYIVYFSYFTFFPVSRHISGPTIWVSHFLPLSFFSPYSRSYIVCYSFSTFSVFLTIFHVLSCEFLILFIFKFYHHLTGSTVCISHFPTFSFVSPYFKS